MNSIENINISELKNDFDNKNMFDAIYSFPSQIKESFDIEMKCYNENIKNFQSISNDINSILICGMGGSAIGGEFARILLLQAAEVPVIINRSSIIPNWVNDKSLIIISSYSGNTYETIDAYEKARQKTSKILVISSKMGLLNKYCLQYNHIIINIPLGLQPRCAFAYTSSMIILQELGAFSAETKIAGIRYEAVKF